MAARFDNAGEWLREHGLTAYHAVCTSDRSDRTVPKCADAARTGRTTEAKDIHADSGVESSGVSRPSDHVPTRMGNRHQLREPESGNRSHKLSGDRSFLRDIVLFRREIDRLRDELQHLECAVALFAKAIEQRTGFSIDRSTVTRFTELQRKRPKAFRVLELISRGRSIKEIAGLIGVSRKTIEDHWRKISRILKVDNHVQAARMFLLVNDS